VQLHLQRPAFEQVLDRWGGGGRRRVGPASPSVRFAHLYGPVATLAPGSALARKHLELLRPLPLLHLITITRAINPYDNNHKSNQSI
jgi:hypothetical protein